VHTENLAKNLPDVIVGQLTQCAESFPRARTRLELFADTVSLVIGLRAEDG
jgi:hypothetical protein